LLAFRLISLLEGISYLLILSVTLGVIDREFVFSLGLAHGVLFMAYMMLSLNVSHKQSWSVVTWLLVFFASIVPFAFIPLELFLRKQLLTEELSEASIN
jgi:integral membrane protein